MSTDLYRVRIHNLGQELFISPRCVSSFKPTFADFYYPQAFNIKSAIKALCKRPAFKGFEKHPCSSPEQFIELSKQLFEGLDWAEATKLLASQMDSIKDLETAQAAAEKGALVAEHLMSLQYEQTLVNFLSLGFPEQFRPIHTWVAQVEVASIYPNDSPPPSAKYGNSYVCDFLLRLLDEDTKAFEWPNEAFAKAAAHIHNGGSSRNDPSSAIVQRLFFYLRESRMETLPKFGSAAGKKKEAEGSWWASDARIRKTLEYYHVQEKMPTKHQACTYTFQLSPFVSPKGASEAVFDTTSY